LRIRHDAGDVSLPTERRAAKRLLTAIRDTEAIGFADSLTARLLVIDSFSAAS
jgi:hypothetical protein